MWTFLFSSGMAPFTGAILFVAGLFVLEIMALVMGGSLMGMDADGPDLDAPDIDADVGEIDISADAAEAEFDMDADLNANAGDAASGHPGALGWFGLKDAPLIVWLAGVATSFGVCGYALQLAVASIFGAPAPAALATAVCVLPSLIGGKFIAAAVARLTPKTETSAVSRRHLGGRLGVITQGVAEMGRPAECRITDRHGNTQYIRVVPQNADDRIPQGSDVIVLRPVNGIYPVIPFEG